MSRQPVSIPTGLLIFNDVKAVGFDGTCSILQTLDVNSLKFASKF